MGATYYIAEKNGVTVRVPASKLNSWTEAEHGKPLNEAEKEAARNLVKRTFPDWEPKD